MRAATARLGRLEPSADDGFVNLDHAAARAEIRVAIIAHGFADAVDLPPILLMRSASPQCGHTRPFGQTRFNLCRVGFFVVKFGAAAG